MSRRLLWWLATAVGLAAAAVLAFGTPVADGPVLCLFRRATALPCPGCGLTRAFVHLARGDVAAAFALHPVAPILALALAGGWSYLGLILHRAVAVPESGRVDRWLLATAVILLFVWMGRLAIGDVAAARP